MRIVYDDSKQKEFVAVLHCFTVIVDKKSISEYSYGMNRVSSYAFKNALNEYVGRYGFEVGKADYHAYGIGNNNRYPVYFHGSDETQHCANININSGLYSEVYVSVEDYNGTLIGPSYEITPTTIRSRYRKG